MVIGLMGDIKIKLGSEKDCVQPVTVEMSNAKVAEHIEKAYKKVQAKVKLPGFRPGKSPIDLIKQKYADTAYGEAQESLLREGVSEAITQKKIHAVHTPMVSKVQFDPNKAFQFEFSVEVAPKFKLSGYKGIKLTKTVVKTTDKDVEKALKELAESNAKLSESKDDALGKNHHASINYEAFLEGKPIKDAKAENFMIDMSAPQNIKGLSEGLLGMKLNEEKDIEVSFPDDAPAKELAGKKATFKVKLLLIKDKKVPNVDDEFAKDLGLESVAKLKERIQESIVKERDNSSKKELNSQVIQKLLENNEFKVPKTLVEKQFEYIKNRQMGQMAQQGMSKDDQEKFFENVKIQMQQQAEKEIRVQYILNSIAESEKIDVSEEEISSRIKAMAMQYGSTQLDKIEQTLRAKYLESIKSDTRDGKVLEWVISHGKIKEVSGGQK